MSLDRKRVGTYCGKLLGVLIAATKNLPSPTVFYIAVTAIFVSKFNVLAI
jgi:hypothetical protein